MRTNKIRIYLKAALLLIFSVVPLGLVDGDTALGQQKFHELESYSVKYMLEGGTEGIKNHYSRNWGNTICMIEVSETEMPGGSLIKKNEKVITRVQDGEQWIYTINLDTNTGTRMKNPVYKSLVEQMEGNSPREFSEQFIKQMGGKVVGEDTVLGEKCTEWDIMGVSRVCVTEDLITLKTSAKMSGVSLSETAIEVKRNEPGPAEACEIGDAKITDLGEIPGQQ